MEIAVPSVRPGHTGARFLRGWLQSWINNCNEFRQWEREEVVLKRPSPETLAEHKKILRSMIWSAHMLQALIADPDYPAREFGPEISGKARQLEESWETIHNPMSDEEADAILAKAFPDGPTTGSPS
jgi:hypothetical protein